MTAHDLEDLQLSIEVRHDADRHRVAAEFLMSVKDKFGLTPKVTVLDRGTLAKEFESSVKTPRFVDRRDLTAPRHARGNSERRHQSGQTRIVSPARGAQASVPAGIGKHRQRPRRRTPTAAESDFLASQSGYAFRQAATGAVRPHGLRTEHPRGTSQRRSRPEEAGAGRGAGRGEERRSLVRRSEGVRAGARGRSCRHRPGSRPNWIFKK